MNQMGQVVTISKAVIEAGLEQGLFDEEILLKHGIEKHGPAETEEQEAGGEADPGADREDAPDAGVGSQADPR
jgi:hypothetical protein